VFEGSPMESPMTESGQWTDTGISGISGNTGDTGSMSKLSKPNQLDLEDASIDADLDDLSEMSPMNNEEVSTSQHVTAKSESVSSDSPKQSTEVTTIEKETIEKSTSLMTRQVEAKTLVQREEKSTSTTALKTCDVQLSPILFTEDKTTSPMSDQGDSHKVQMVDASSSPPTKVVMTSAATSPPKPSDLQLTKSSSPTSSKEKDEDEKDPLSFEFELDLSAQDDVDRAKLEQLKDAVTLKIDSLPLETVSIEQFVQSETNIKEENIHGTDLKLEKTSKNIIEQQTKVFKETINQKTAIMLSDEEDKLKMDQEETEKEMEDTDTKPMEPSVQSIKIKELETEYVLDSKTETFTLLEDEGVDEGVDLSSDEPIEVVRLSESPKLEISDTVETETESYVIVGTVQEETLEKSEEIEETVEKIKEIKISNPGNIMA
jgi:hypothetical protein